MKEQISNLFAGLPPPSLAEALQPSATQEALKFKAEVEPLVPPNPPQVPKGALKRPEKRSATQVEDNKEAGDKEGVCGFSSGNEGKSISPIAPNKLRASFSRAVKLISVLLAYRYLINKHRYSLATSMDLNELPQDMVEQILIRTPYTCHRTLKLTCKVWKDMVETESLRQSRIVFGKSEKFICVLHKYGIIMYDPVRGSWHKLPPFPTKFKASASTHLVGWRRKLVVTNLKHEGEIFGYTLVYDFCFNSHWRVGRMDIDWSKRRLYHINCVFSFTASADGTVHFPEGLTYMINEDRWELKPDMATRDFSECLGGLTVPSGVSIAGMAYLFDYITNHPEIFDPNTGKWTRIYNLVPVGNEGTKDFGSDFYRELCGRMRWDRIFWYGRRPPFRNTRRDKRFYMFQPDAPISQRWIDIQTPVDLTRFSVYSATTVEI